jgi:hypothetical protein
MSSEKHPNLQLHKWAPTDYVKREEWNENFGIIDDKIGILSSNTINVLSYGAVGDWDGSSGTDNTSFIQNALDALNAMGGGVLIFPYGKKFKVKSLKFYSNIIIELNGSTLVVDPNDTTYKEAIFVSEGWLDGTKTTNDAVIRNGTLDCGNQANYGVFVHQANRVKVLNCKILNVKKGGIRFNNDTSDCVAAFNHIYLPVDNPYGTIAEAKGIYCVSSTVDSQGGGMNDTLSFTEATNLSQNHLIQGNFIYDGTHSIHLWGAHKCRVIGNFLYKPSHRGIILSPVSHYNDIIGNSVEDFQSTGIHLAWGCQYNNIVGNICKTTVSDLEGNGIKMYYGCKNNHIGDNVVKGTKYAGYRVSVGCPYNSIVGNRAFNCGTGIELESFINSNSDYYNENVYQPATPPVMEQCIVVGNHIATCTTGIRIAQRGTVELKRNKIGDNHVTGSTNGVVLIEETTNYAYSLNITGNSIQGSSTADWTLPRGTNHCTEFSGNTGYNFIKQGYMVFWYDNNNFVRTATSHPTTDPNTQGTVVTTIKSGTTANRPTTVYVGMPYFDTTLGKMIWVKQVSPTVWVDGTGATV